jgi:hypothetical protein
LGRSSTRPRHLPPVVTEFAPVIDPPPTHDPPRPPSCPKPVSPPPPPPPEPEQTFTNPLSPSQPPPNEVPPQNTPPPANEPPPAKSVPPPEEPPPAKQVPKVTGLFLPAPAASSDPDPAKFGTFAGPLPQPQQPRSELCISGAVTIEREEIPPPPEPVPREFRSVETNTDLPHMYPPMAYQMPPPYAFPPVGFAMPGYGLRPYVGYVPMLIAQDHPPAQPPGHPPRQDH